MAEGTLARAAYPAEVEDLLEAHGGLGVGALSAAGVAGYAVVAAAGATRAHLFAVAGAPSARDALPLPLPAPSNVGLPRPPRLAAWSPTSHRISVATLDAAGALRVYAGVDPSARAPPRPREVRVARALALSARAEAAAVEALEVVHARDSTTDTLFVFGARGSAALVRLGEFTPSAEPLVRESGSGEAGKRSGISFGQLFYSALRTIGADARPDAADWEAGTGIHRIVGKGALSSMHGACVVKEGGIAELWGAERLLWSVDVFEVSGVRTSADERRVVCASVSVEDTLICLLEEVVEGVPRFRIVGFPAHEAPQEVAVQIDLNDITNGRMDVDVRMTLSEGLAYVHVPGTRQLSWVSVARGIGESDQVHGSVTLAEDVYVLHVLDAAHSSSSNNNPAVSGGLVACLCADSVNLVSSGVPAPMSMQDGEVAPSSLMSDDVDVNAMLWRAQLQFRAGQIGAVRASLRGLYRATFENGAPSTSFLGEVVHDASQIIISSQSDPASAPLALLVDDELERRQSDYNSFLRLLGDAEVFACIRDDAPSTTDDRLWDALSPDVRHAVLCNGEKLAVARAVRDVENNHVSGSTTQSFGDPAATSLIGSEALPRTASVLPTVVTEDLRDVEAELCEGGSIVSRALFCAGAAARTNDSCGDEGSFLYRFPLHFHGFLPALRDCLGEATRRARASQDDHSTTGGSVVMRALRNVTLLACHAAIAVVRTARETRSNAIAHLERDQYVLRSFRNWASNEDARDTLEVLSEAALELRSGGRQNELAQLRLAAAIVSDELLACTRAALFDTNGAPAVPGTNATPSMKKRRLNEGDDTSAWGRSRTKVLDRLRSALLDDAALELAEKYRDFGTIMSLKKECEDFDEYFANALENYGDEFGFYALRWLEERGEIKLLLKGREAFDSEYQTGLSSRSGRVAALVSTYFLEERATSANLSWMHWLGTGDLSEGARVVTAQLRSVAKPGHPGSLRNTRVLSSVARLAHIAADMQLAEADAGGSATEADEDRVHVENDKRYVYGRLHLSAAQERISDACGLSDALLSVDELVRQYIDSAPIATKKLAEHASIAIEAVEFGELEVDAVHELKDYVWRRCVEREGHMWMQIVANCRQISDGQLRARLEGTAIYMVARIIGTTSEEIREVVQRNAFNIPEFHQRGCQVELENIVQKAVGLAVASR